MEHDVIAWLQETAALTPKDALVHLHQSPNLQSGLSSQLQRRQHAPTLLTITTDTYSGHYIRTGMNLWSN